LLNLQAIVIVPKSIGADFLMKGCASGEAVPTWSRNSLKLGFDAENLFNYFQRLLQAEPGDADHTNSLRQVCSRVLSNQITFSQALVHRATEIAAQLGNLDLLEYAMLAHQGYLTAATALTIGKLLSNLTLDHFKRVYGTFPIRGVKNQMLTLSSLTKPITSLEKLSRRHEVIRSLTTALLDERADQPKQDVDAKIDWLVSTLEELLAASDALEADDAKALFEILGTPRPPKNFLDR
jgi:hypothetical protein